MGIKLNKFRKSARGQDCTFNIPNVCNWNPETTVLCHAPSPVKGMGNKGDDYFAAFGCSDCHRALDERTVYNPQYYWLEAIRRTWAIWIEMGLIQIGKGN